MFLVLTNFSVRGGYCCACRFGRYSPNAILSKEQNEKFGVQRYGEKIKLKNKKGKVLFSEQKGYCQRYPCCSKQPMLFFKG